MLEALVYTSFLKESFNESELEKILAAAEKNNPSVSVTGCLVYKNGIFLQLLEGDSKDLDTIYSKISKDPRHENIAKLYRGRIQDRLFPDWSMAYREGREIKFDWVNEILGLGSRLKKPNGDRYLKIFKDLSKNVAA